MNLKNEKHRIKFSQFRLAAHKLGIETGRFEDIERANRICKLCNSKQIETEYLFLWICPKFHDHDLYNNYLYN